MKVSAPGTARLLTVLAVAVAIAAGLVVVQRAGKSFSQSVILDGGTIVTGSDLPDGIRGSFWPPGTPLQAQCLPVPRSPLLTPLSRPYELWASQPLDSPVFVVLPVCEPVSDGRLAVSVTDMAGSSIADDLVTEVQVVNGGRAVRFIAKQLGIYQPHRVDTRYGAGVIKASVKEGVKPRRLDPPVPAICPGLEPGTRPPLLVTVDGPEVISACIATIDGRPVLRVVSQRSVAVRAQTTGLTRRGDDTGLDLSEYMTGNSTVLMPGASTEFFVDLPPEGGRASLAVSQSMLGVGINLVQRLTEALVESADQAGIRHGLTDGTTPLVRALLLHGSCRNGVRTFGQEEVIVQTAEYCMRRNLLAEYFGGATPLLSQVLDDFARGDLDDVVRAAFGPGVDDAAFVTVIRPGQPLIPYIGEWRADSKGVVLDIRPDGTGSYSQRQTDGQCGRTATECLLLASVTDVAFVDGSVVAAIADVRFQATGSAGTRTLRPVEPVATGTGSGDVLRMSHTPEGRLRVEPPDGPAVTLCLQPGLGRC